MFPVRKFCILQKLTVERSRGLVLTMTIKIFALICLANYVNFVHPYSISVTKCDAADSKCIKKSSQAFLPTLANGIPELGIAPLDPAYFDKPVDASISGLKVFLDDFTVTGLKGCTVKKLQRDVEKSKIIASLLCTVNIEGQYEMEGKLLIITAKGKGKLHALLRKLFINLEADIVEKTGKDGKKHWDIKRFTHSFELKDKADVEFENLFTGNDVLGRAAQDIIASSGNEIVLELGPPITKTIVTRVIEHIQKLFSKVPLEDLV